MKTSYYIFALLYASSFGLGMVLSKLGLNYNNPILLFFFQILSGTILLWIISLIKGQQPKSISFILKNGYAGLFEPALAYTIGTIGLLSITASVASFIGSLEVIITVLLSVFVLKEHLSVQKIILTLTSFFGILLVVSPWQEATGDNHFLGMVLYFIGVIFTVLYAIISKKQIHQTEPLTLVTAQQTFGFIVVLIIASIASILHFEDVSFPTELMFYVLAFSSGLLLYCIPYLIYLLVLKRNEVSNTTFFVGLIPVFTSIFAALILNEAMQLLQYVGGMLVIIPIFVLGLKKTNA